MTMPEQGVSTAELWALYGLFLLVRIWSMYLILSLVLEYFFRPALEKANKSTPEPAVMRQVLNSFGILSIYTASTLAIHYSNLAYSKSRDSLVVSNHTSDVTSVFFSPISPTLKFSPASALYYLVWFLLMLLIVDTMFYWTHRAFHSRHLYGWKGLHVVHHKAKSPRPWSALSADWREGLILVFSTNWLPFYLLSVDPRAAFFFGAFSIFWSTFLHTPVKFTDSWSRHTLLKYIYTPYLHRIHHQKGFGNYSLFFTLWDSGFDTLIEKRNDSQEAG